MGKGKHTRSEELADRLVTVQSELALLVARLTDVATGLTSLLDVDAVTIVERRRDEVLCTVDASAGAVAERAKACFDELDNATASMRARCDDFLSATRATTEEAGSRATRHVDAFEKELAELRGQAEEAVSALVAASTSAREQVPTDGRGTRWEDDGNAVGAPPDEADAQLQENARPVADSTDDRREVGTDGGTIPDAIAWSSASDAPLDHDDGVFQGAGPLDDHFLAQLSGRAGTATTAAPLQAAPRSTVHPSRARSVTLSVPLPILRASVEAIHSAATGDRLGLNIVQTVNDGAITSALRLASWNDGGWWEWIDVPVTTDRLDPRPTVISLADLQVAIDALQRDLDHADVVVEIDDDVTVGQTLCLARDGGAELPPGPPSFIEHVELDRVQGDVAIETQAGRVTVPARLASLLRSRAATTTDLVAVGERLCLRSSVPGPTVGVVATIVAPVDSDADSIAPDRRGDPTSPVAQLFGSLSSTSSPEDLERIIRTGVGYVRRVAAAHPSLPPELISELVTEGTEAMRAAAAGNPSIANDMSDIAAGDISPVVRGAVAGNPSADLGRLTRLSLDKDAYVRMRVGSNIATNSALLAHLSTDPDGSVRAAVAANESTDAAALEALARDPDLTVCSAVAENPNCPPASLEELVTIVPASVMANPRTPVSLLSAGSRVPDRTLRLAVAGNPATPAKRLEVLARAEDPEVLRAVASNPSTPQQARRRVNQRLKADAGA